MTSIDLVWLVALAVEVVATGAWFVVLGVWVILLRRARADGQTFVMPWPAALAPPVVGGVAAGVRVWTQLGSPAWVPVLSVALWTTIAVAEVIAGVWSRRVAAQVAALRAQNAAMQAELARRGVML